MGSFVGNLLGTNSTATAAPPPQQNFTPQINTANQDVNANINNQNAFAKALQTQMGGGGPNLAGAQLANATGQNVSNQAALMASQRGTGSNAGLIARQAAQQDANIQQQAAGQAAAERQAQQLNAQGLLGSTYGNIGSEANQNLGIEQGALTAQNQGIVSSNQINANTAEANAKNNAGMLGGLGAAAITGGASLLAPAAAQGLQTAGGGSDINNSMFAAEGGEVPNKYSSEMHPHIKSVSDIYHPQMSAHNGYNAASNAYASGGKVNAMVSPGERSLKPEQVKKVVEGKADPIESGEKILGKPKVPGAVNSYANDIVPKKLDVGGIIIPRSITMGPDPKKHAFAFVVKELSKKKVKK